MFSTILPSRMQTLLALGLLLVGFGLPQHPGIAQHLSNLIGTGPDWRQKLEGSWDCSGVSTLGGKGEEPYMGRLDNHWARGRSWLTLGFAEQRSEGKPFGEQQLWEEVSADGTHRRTIITNDGTWGIVISSGPQGKIMQWEGSFGAMALSETLTLLSANEHQWYGKLTQGKQQIGYYQLTCSRVSSHS